VNKIASTFAAFVTMFAPLSAAGGAPAVELVQDLYRDSAWEAVMAGPEFRQPGLLDQPESVLKQFFTPGITALLLKDRAEAAEAGEVGRIDFLPLWASQDPSASDLRVGAGPKPDTVTVSFQTVGAESRTEIVFVIEETPAGVRIADIKYPSGNSFAALLKADN
jgi:hypothetical protein